MVMPASPEYDAVIIGGGPAGASTGALLAEKGHRVLILEREKFPRYHIGESLIPFTFGPLERLGLVERMKASHFQKKYSVMFVQPDGKRSQPFYFHTRYDINTVAQTWQVLRSEFDEMLLNHAAEKGAEVRQQCSVTSLLRDADDAVCGVTVKYADGTTEEITARLTIDATGKEAFTSNRLGWRLPDPKLNKVAVWTYYEGSTRESGIDEGTTTVAAIPEKGWFWHIPQHGDRISVGVVAEGKYLSRDGVKDPKEMMDREIANNPWMRERLASGRQVGEYWLTSEYSRHSKYGAAPGLLLVGDAFAFLDPVFSSGVMLALKSGVLAADAVHAALEADDVSPERFTDYGAAIRVSVENMRKLVYAFYDPNFSFKDLIMRFPEAAADVTDCLSGDLGRDYTKLWAQISEFVDLPSDLPYGAPLLQPAMA
jgi:flavin-dependent dehydrogenase